MTKLLEEAFREASKLSEIDQNTLARWVLAELHSDRIWMQSFADSEDVLELLANEALDEKKKGKAVFLDLESL